MRGEPGAIAQGACPLIRRDDTVLIARRVVEGKMDPYLGFSLLGVIARGLGNPADLAYFADARQAEAERGLMHDRASEIRAACDALLRSLAARPANLASGTSIEPVTTLELAAFAAYLDDHIRDNGIDGQYFQPLPRGATKLPDETLAMFRHGSRLPVGAVGWRRAWVMVGPDVQIVGHVDLRSHPEPHASHRCLLGMGVHRQHRRQGVGTALVAFAEQWAAETVALEWIDLQALGSNSGALKLYRRMGFAIVCEVPERFRIDGRLFSYVSMSKRLTQPNTSAQALPL